MCVASQQDDLFERTSRLLLMSSRGPTSPLLSSSLLSSPLVSRSWRFARQDQELYISELEGKNQVPEGKEAVHPVPGFVIKTKFTKGSKDAVPEKVT